MGIRPGMQRPALKLWAVIGDEDRRPAAGLGHALKHGDDLGAAEAHPDLDHRTLPGAVVHQREGAEDPALGQRVAHEVQRPALIGPGGCRPHHPGAPQALPPLAAHGEPCGPVEPATRL